MGTRAPPFVAMLDACVLYPAPLRDLLIQIASAGLFRAKWTERIHEEWIASLLGKRSDLSRAQLERTRSLMNAAVLDCLVNGYEPLLQTVKLPDDDDRHIIAAAIHARCDTIVTFNLRDFPPALLAAHGIEAVHPDAFTLGQFGRDQTAIIHAAAACRSRLRSPPVDAMAYLDILRRQSLPKTVAALAPFASAI